ncbi:hypothetical protein A3A76_02770 [Candidatus Woesebacteria bacterium RIFCSPLOWO2_01_FULL_39_23]|uniref:Uncharacterized protein n=1 Tax=Candidatus Woesebacteria bacterium RIFCSPHIGHO2_01_FULL_40_22 TaxID=1802499 RepID=A0A1F7YLC2_9BACT|nr:MAG: hypothetical protein A2141_01250 [Candidatus Woesebacteria bacterium RBG_16_40_11]OGM27398.1 MAG: hypothetical protein A2628_01175 [Candidatus Woesebacteria bacterium RIFCSPHIGHO2_01_FULL_40_22]OGM36162.1 MAG: hypothetical protein A3E41_01455 [Candidatus Woesebacteria bacterium RIFCSPHIGHO2_12_FULL_38_9]OGM62570.1 MAG: hypothetical protein A3A76_02770 [Candidatus Woesebacteria bacterium RIFCSPLOWO2_01_FULL_39_23]
MKTFIKSKSAPNAAGPKYRTPSHFKGSLPRRQAGIFSGGKINSKMNASKFNPSQFRTQHKGG